MCSGEYSSIIRRDLEKREALPFVYKDEFLEELRPFIPHLKMCRFLGGEPFMISFYFKILKLLDELNPECKVFFTSNITAIPPKGWYYLTKLKNFNIIGSIDSLVKDNYKKIRLGGNFEDMFDNLHKLIELKKIKTMTINPLIYNFLELGELIKFACRHNLTLFFNNTVDFLSGHKEDVHYKNNELLYVKQFIHQLSEDEFNEGINKIKSYVFEGYYKTKQDELLNLLKNIFDYKIKAITQ
jgi:sulfatase maturation enzyme AslB (radical SAM superfamily)